MSHAPDMATEKFRTGLELAASNFAAEALTAFKTVVERWPKHDLADDALFNMGACYLAMRQPVHAAEAFRQIIAQYPDATISPEGSFGHETGRTAAKAWLGLMTAHLSLGDVARAREACAKLAEFPESRVHPAPGVERTFAEIGRSLLDATTASLGDVDHVAQSDVIEA